MPDSTLYHKLCDFNGDAYRNIVSLKESEDLFDDISDGDVETEAVAIRVEMEGKKDLPPVSDLIGRSMAYSEAIGYPFDQHDPPLFSRYSDGRFPVWYGSLSWETTVRETAYHFLIAELGREGASPVLYRERKVYLVHCEGLLLDLRGKASEFPDLIANQYHFCRSIGARCQREGIPGIISPSARDPEGENLSIFRRQALSNARVTFFLSYELNLEQRQVKVLRGDEELIFNVSL